MINAKWLSIVRSSCKLPLKMISLLECLIVTLESIDVAIFYWARQLLAHPQNSIVPKVHYNKVAVWLSYAMMSVSVLIHQCI